jgi:hypothetical protein
MTKIKKSKENVSILQLLPRINKQMKKKRILIDRRLSEISGVSPGSVSRFLNHGEISGENLLKILQSLDMIKDNND